MRGTACSFRSGIVSSWRIFPSSERIGSGLRQCRGCTLSFLMNFPFSKHIWPLRACGLNCEQSGGSPFNRNLCSRAAPACSCQSLNLDKYGTSHIIRYGRIVIFDTLVTCKCALSAVERRPHLEIYLAYVTSPASHICPAYLIPYCTAEPDLQHHHTSTIRAVNPVKGCSRDASS